MELEQQFPEYVTTGFIAKCCRVSKTTVLKWIESGKLKAFKLPSGHCRIDRDDFKDFVKQYEIPLKGWTFKTRETQTTTRK